MGKLSDIFEVFRKVFKQDFTMSLLARAGEAIRNSPLMARKPAGDYALAQDDDYDPFTQGITFYCEFMNMKELPPEAGRADKNNEAILENLHCNAKPPFKKYSVLVKDRSIRLKDLSKNLVMVEIPIHLVSYCGSHASLDRSFYLIYRDAQKNVMVAQLMQAADKPKAQAMVKTVSKAFNIAFSSWKAKSKEQEKSSLAANPDSPRTHRKLGELKKPQGRSSPAAARSHEEPAKPVEQVTEKMGQVTVTVPKPADEDIEDEFTALAASRSHPDLLASDLVEDPKQFSWKETKAHADPGSTSNLLDL